MLYTELESASDLRQTVNHLTADVTRLQQDLSLSRKELGLAQKMSEAARISPQELARLRSEAARRQAAEDEVASLKLEKQQLEADLEKSKKTIQDWKRSLSSLVSE